MTTICHYDHNLIFTGDVASIPDKNPVPRGWVAAEPPKGAGVWRWANTRWIKLDEYPASPPVPVPHEKTKEEYEAELEARLEKSALIALIDERIAAAKEVKVEK